jgi:hypothetical protein
LALLNSPILSKVFKGARAWPWRRVGEGRGRLRGRERDVGEGRGKGMMVGVGRNFGGGESGSI